MMGCRSEDVSEKGSSSGTEFELKINADPPSTGRRKDQYVRVKDFVQFVYTPGCKDVEPQEQELEATSQRNVQNANVELSS